MTYDKANCTEKTRFWDSEETCELEQTARLTHISKVLHFQLSVRSLMSSTFLLWNEKEKWDAFMVPDAKQSERSTL